MFHLLIYHSLTRSLCNHCTLLRIFLFSFPLSCPVLFVSFLHLININFHNLTRKKYINTLLMKSSRKSEEKKNLINIYIDTIPGQKCVFWCCCFGKALNIFFLPQQPDTLHLMICKNNTKNIHMTLELFIYSAVIKQQQQQTYTKKWNCFEFAFYFKIICVEWKKGWIAIDYHPLCCKEL